LLINRRAAGNPAPKDAIASIACQWVARIRAASVASLSLASDTLNQRILKHAIFDAMRKTPARTTKKSALEIAAAAAKRERKAKARE